MVLSRKEGFNTSSMYDNREWLEFILKLMLRDDYKQPFYTPQQQKAV